MVEDAELLRRYAREKSEPAFAELVQRHLNLVYAAALRRVGGDTHLAEDITQQVFTALARNAATLGHHPVLSGWLYTATRNLAVQLVRSEHRRQAREQEAQTMNELTSAPTHDAEWEQIRPMIDGAMDQLGEADRQAVLLRFFERKSFLDVGLKLRLTENAARMRVERALDKLHALLARRGVTSTTGALALALANQTAVVTPTGLATMVTGAALADAGIAGGTIWTTLSSMKVGMAIGGALVLAIVGTVTQKARTTPKEPIAAVSATQPTAEITAPARDAKTEVQNAIPSSSARASEQGTAQATVAPVPVSGLAPKIASQGSRTVAGVSAAAPLPAPLPAAPVSYELVKLKVLRVFSVNDGDAVFRAYAVSWRDQEVVAGDTLAQTNFDVGEIVEVLVLHPSLQGTEGHGLGFEVMSSGERRNTGVPPTTGTAALPISTARSQEELRLEVLKVFSAQDGDGRFRAYVVNWKNQEIAVRDMLMRSDYRVGDTVSVVASKRPYPNGKARPGLLRFSIMPRPIDRVAR
ncbi:MAG: sigma-70 family RNA polymerase sigma factor [Opitutaceae bacterium]